VFARHDRDQIFDFLEAMNPRAAVKIDERIAAQTALLAEFPEMGRSGRVHGTRELVINGTPYLAAYRVEVSSIRVLRVLHGSQEWPDDFPDSG